MEIERIAEICHEVNRGLCEALGDESQARWEDAPEWQRESAGSGVQNVRAMLKSGGIPQPEDSHKGWMVQKINDGWRYGEVKDPEAKTHPCLVPFDELPIEQQLKDHLFVTTARVLLSKGD